MTDALFSSKTLALEVADLSDAALGKAMATSADLLFYADGQTLEQNLQKAEFERVRTLTAKADIPADVSKLLKPWLVSTLLAISDCERRQIEAGLPVVDMRLAELAKEKGIPVVGLETIELQLAALASVPDDEQLQMLKVGLAYADRTSDMLETFATALLEAPDGRCHAVSDRACGEVGIYGFRIQRLPESTLGRSQCRNGQKSGGAVG